MPYLRSATAFAFLATLLTFAGPAFAANKEDNLGPFNVTILEGGEGLTRKLSPDTHR